MKCCFLLVFHQFLQPVDTPMESQDFLSTNPEAEPQNNNPLPPPPSLDEECESMGSATSANSIDGETMHHPNPESSQYSYPVVYPATYVTPIYPLPIPYWPGYCPEPAKAERHEVFKPTAVHTKSPINVDELVGMSKLSLGESLGDVKPPVSLKLAEGSTRQSAFHAKPASGNSSMSSSHNPIHAV